MSPRKSPASATGSASWRVESHDFGDQHFAMESAGNLTVEIPNTTADGTKADRTHGALISHAVLKDMSWVKLHNSPKACQHSVHSCMWQSGNMGWLQLSAKQIYLSHTFSVGSMVHLQQTSCASEALEGWSGQNKTSQAASVIDGRAALSCKAALRLRRRSKHSLSY